MENIDGLYKKLLVASVLNLIGKLSESFILSRTENLRLLSFASLISLSSKDNDRIKAYEIVSRIIEIPCDYDSSVFSAVDVILSRIGNFPGRRLMRERFNDGAEPKLNMHLSLERIARECENLSDGIELTDFQYNLFSSLGYSDSLSVSAPTSAGKSFVLTLNTIRAIKNNPKECIVYVVPTRALISEVSSNLRVQCKKNGLNDVIIRTSPSIVDIDKVTNGLVYVLTQERLISLLSEIYVNPMFAINLLLVDEAHEIQKGKRGIILQNAIELVLQLGKNTSVMFSSPLIKNPEYFLSLFRRTTKSISITEKVSPVAQNILLVNSVQRKTHHIHISALFDDYAINIGEFEIGFKFRGDKAEQKSSFAKFVSENGGAVIVFENNPAEAKNIALSLAGKLGRKGISEAFIDFIEFVKEEIHADYSLISCLESGVAFHYGNMPSVIRGGIEYFFKNGDIDFIVCTSTLLQGVNLPAKHIILENPQSGQEPMSRSDFQNLSGRAGRLMKEFHGNVWCLRSKEWDVSSFEGEKLQTISSAMSNIMYDGGELILNAFEGFLEDEKEQELADIALAKLYHDLKRDGYVSDYYLNSPGTSNYMDILEYNHEKVNELAITVPDDILLMHKGIRPDYIQFLWDYFDAQEDLSHYILYSPYSKGGKQKVDLAINVIRDVFNWRISDNYAKWISMLAHKWMTTHSLSSILKYAIDSDLTLADKVKGENDPSYKSKRISKVVRELLKSLENQVRYNLVRYMTIYQDVLECKLIERGLCSSYFKVEPISAYLEFGSCNPKDLNLMSLGISRSTALMIRKKINFPFPATPEDYLSLLSRRDLNKLQLPKYSLKEINDLLGKTTIDG